MVEYNFIFSSQPLVVNDIHPVTNTPEPKRRFVPRYVCNVTYTQKHTPTHINTHIHISTHLHTFSHTHTYIVLALTPHIHSSLHSALTLLCSKWEAQRVAYLVQAIRKGWISLDEKPKKYVCVLREWVCVEGIDVMRDVDIVCRGNGLCVEGMGYMC